MAFLDFLQAVASPISSVIGAIGQGISNRAQAKENEKNRQWSLEQWNRENEYNLPINQLSRQFAGLKAYGLNPNLVYGEGLSGFSSQAGTANNPQTDTKYENPFKGGISLDSYFQSRQLEMQQQATDSSVALNKSQEGKNKADADKATLESVGISAENAIKLATVNEQISTIKEKLSNLKKEGKVLDEKVFQELEKSLQELEHTKQELEATKQAQEATNQSIAQTAQANEAVETQKAMTRNFLAQAEQASSSAELNRALKANQKYVREELKENAGQARAMAKKLSMDYHVSENEAYKIIIDAYNALQNGKVDRFMKTGPQRFGTGILGSAIGAWLDTIGAKTGAYSSGSYYYNKLKDIYGSVKGAVKRNLKPKSTRGGGSSW